MNPESALGCLKSHRFKRVSRVLYIEGLTGLSAPCGNLSSVAVAHGSKPGWFVVSGDDALLVRGLPGVNLIAKKGEFVSTTNARFEAHQSTLALLHDGARYALPRANPVSIWEARDHYTEMLGFKLRTTQHQALDFIGPRRGVLLGDDPRIGKTLCAVMAHDASRGSLWVVAPLSTRAVWLGWLRRVFPGTSIGVITGRKFDAKTLEAPIVFGHYDVIHSWQVDHPIGTLVFDEAHLLTNPETRRSNAAAFLQSRAKKVLALTGTPIWNLPPNLWSVLNLLAPGAWGSFHDFARRYGAPETTAYGTRYTGISHEAELRLRLQEIMLRRRWVDVLDDLPPISRSVVVAEVDEAIGRKLDILAAALKSERTNTVGNLASYRRSVASVKVHTTVMEAKKILDRGEPVVIWAWHKDVAEQIHKNLVDGCGISAFVIHGDIAPKARDQQMDLWRAQPAAALIATMPVAQVGIDLSHARVAIFAEIDYTPAVIAQAEMRTFAPNRPMDILFVIANHLVDQRIVRALINKLSAADPVGVGAANAAIDALREAVLGPQDSGDLDRLLEDLIGSAA